MIKRSSKKFIDNLLKNNTTWKILDIGCGYTAHSNASTICDVQDLSNFYKDKEFVKIEAGALPFKDKEFDFVIENNGTKEELYAKIDDLIVSNKITDPPSKPTGATQPLAIGANSF